MVLTCFSTVWSVTNRRAAIALLEPASAINASTSRSRSLRSANGLGAVGGGQGAARPRIHDGLALADTADAGASTAGWKTRSLSR